MKPLKKDYNSFEEWLSWDEDVRAELHDGMLVMRALPSRRHQDISGYVFHRLYSFLEGKSCKVYHAPFGVRLTSSEDTVFEPDIVVVCDKTKLGDSICHGAPDLIMEILSPSTERADRVVKFKKYQKAGVREYWILDPKLNVLQVNTLTDNGYITTMYDQDDIAPVSILEGCKINLAEVFTEE